MFENQAFGNFDSLSDVELVKLAKNSDEGAFRELVVRYLYLIRSVAAEYKKSGLEPDDLIQEGLLGLLSAVNSYDETKGSAFKSYAGVCVKNKIVSAVRTALSDKNKILNDSVLLDDETELSADHLSEPESVVISQEAEERLYTSIEQNLTELEKKVLSLYLLGYSYAEISAEIGINEKACDNAMQRVRKKLKKH
ncbi:MAG: sigma-70 family RNA polymerase sigma factor [Candidatus Pseudoruminococcus sp.]|uniref:sigma-70 family RNA polymerase sigma factor n=1 Tax=Candidatus Pseudoruminococcus sp. TaxID=3101048 RepID=UPI002A7DCFEE|nr:sigma-70 family RNA polymerase sigma factor [Ruminococcus sp.]MDY2782475.1 sigma-70 family RNA polymerase sigma factor [Candidatus Pseudoruminococcus sp.]